MMAQGLDVRELATAIVHASMLLDARRQSATDHAQTLKSASLVISAASVAERTRSRDARAPRVPSQRARELVGFSVEGVVNGERVAAHLHNGQLECDESLRDRALFLVDLGEELIYSNPPRRFNATLTGRPVAVALTLLRSCDRVIALEFDLP